MQSVDVPEDVKQIEAKMSAQWVVSLDNCLVEILDSGISGFAKSQTKHVFEGVMIKWLDGIDLNLLSCGG